MYFGPAWLFITMACDISKSCDAVCLWLIHRLQQTGPLMAWHITSAREAWPIGDKRAWSLISDSSWPSPYQSSALLLAQLCHFNYIKPYSRNALQCAREHSLVREAMCFEYPSRIRPRLCFHIAVIWFNSLSMLSAANNSRFSSLRRDRVTLTYDSLT